MSECIFCRIAQNEIPNQKILETAHFFAIRDLHPQAPHHILVMPKKHIENVACLRADETTFLGSLVLTACQIAKEQGVSEKGYRLVINCNDHGGQTVSHLHVHLLAGRKMVWPPG